MSRRIKIFLFFILILPGISTHGQSKTSLIIGTITDTTGSPIPLVNIYIPGTTIGTYSNNLGEYALRLDRSSDSYSIMYSTLGYKEHIEKVIIDKDTIELNVKLSIDVTQLNEVLVREQGITEAPTMARIPIKDINMIPVTGSGVESLLTTLPGIISSNEMSSSYTVRGGSYDENLVYINGVEIYRPQLISSGRKEGLSIINPDLVSSLYFSPGGFNSSYGGKMSSILDVRYSEPDSFKGSTKLSLMTNSIHLEGSNNKNFTYLIGSRYMTNRILLQTLDTKANYTPSYYDFQSIFSLKAGNKSKLDLYLSVAKNKFEFTPVSQRSTFGTFTDAYQIFVDFDGFEKDKYLLLNSSLTWNIEHAENFESSLMIQNTSSEEEESFDLHGRYSLNQLDKNLGSENFGDSLINIGVGSWLDHARNYLHTNAVIVSYKSRWQHSRNIISWGLTFKHESVQDNVNEWRMIDSAGYSIPLSSSGLNVNKYINSSNNFSSNRTNLYILDNYTFSIQESDIIITGGARLSHWSLNNEILFSPRISMEVSPNRKLSFYFATGKYFQTPFYREMRVPDGSLNLNIKSQEAIHFVMGSRVDFSIGNTQFRFSGEVYHKILNNLIPYKFDNVRVIYAGENIATGKTSGIDLRLNGEFVKSAESWISLSFMKASHNIENDELGSYPAPGDIRFSTDVFFQDYFPSNPTFKAHIKLHFSTGMPVSSPYEDLYHNYYRMPPYRRVDIGFSKSLKDRFTVYRSGNPLNIFDNIVFGVEIFNLIDINNTVSYNWLSTINNLSGEERQFAIPNYLTGRSLNLKLNFEF